MPDFAPTPPRVFPDLVIGREITERGKSRRGEDKVSICMMWACVGWVAPIVPIGACLAQPLRLLHPPWLPPPALSPASQSFFHLYKFFSNLMQIQSELDCLTSRYSKFNQSIAIWIAFDSGKDFSEEKASAMRLLVVFSLILTP